MPVQATCLQWPDHNADAIKGRGSSSKLGLLDLEARTKQLALYLQHERYERYSGEI